MVGRSQDKLETKRAELKRLFPNVEIEMITSEASDVSAANFERIVGKVQGKDLRILVNNVGVGQGGQHKLHDLSEANLHSTITVNTLYPTLLTHALLPVMLKSGGKKLIINLASIAGLIVSPYSSIYGATKAFNRSFSLNIAAEYAGDGIDVLCVNPGLVSTPMTAHMKESLVCCSSKACIDCILRRHDQIDIIPHIKHLSEYGIYALISAVLPDYLLLKIINLATVYFRRMFDAKRAKN